MTRHYGNQPSAFEKINYMTLTQQAEIIKLIEEIEAADKLTIPRIIVNNDDEFCWIRSKNDNRYWISKLGASPIKVIVDYMRADHNLLIGEPTAEKVVEDIGSVLPLPQEVTFIVKGRNLVTGLPTGTEISSIQVREVLGSQSFDENFIKNLKQYLSNVSIWHQVSPDQVAQAQIILRGTLPHIRGLKDQLQEISGLEIILE